MNVARTNKSKMRVTFACVSLGYTQWRGSLTGKDIQYCRLQMECNARLWSVWAVGNEGMTHDA